ncbi:MAG: hypothetical protein HGA54_03870 [Actinobacteria bacterium]|nr:hypothetical protein [Actinomycetota bacterium]
MIIGTYIDGRPLEYDESHYQFSVGGTPVSLPAVRSYDTQGHIAWSMTEQRDWMYSIDEGAFVRAHDAAVAQAASAMPQASRPVPPQGFDGTVMPGVQEYRTAAKAPVGAPKKSNTKTVIVIIVVVVLLLCACCAAFSFIGYTTSTMMGTSSCSGHMYSNDYEEELSDLFDNLDS